MSGANCKAFPLAKFVGKDNTYADLKSNQAILTTIIGLIHKYSRFIILLSLHKFAIVFIKIDWKGQQLSNDEELILNSWSSI